MTSAERTDGIPRSYLEMFQVECAMYAKNKCYRNFQDKEILTLLRIVPFSGTIYSCYSLIDHIMRFSGSDVIRYGIIVSGFCMFIHLLFWILLTFKFKSLTANKTKIIIAMLIFINIVNILTDILIINSPCGYRIIPWVLIQIYVVYGTLQFSRDLCCVTSLITFIAVFVIVGNISTVSGQHLKELANSLLLMLTISVLGYCSYTNLQDRLIAFFVEGKMASEIRDRLHREVDAQRTLMISVLPKHFAEEIYEDVGGDSLQPFRKMYITKHDNVSILFADIVGFTYLSSFCSAVQLVNLLNKIFASFDNTAVKYDQLRLKILGDCYYCICGLPIHRPDHALMSITMGFEMIEIIQSISSKVNMRIGIHTGSVLSGVLGLYQWQFDVLGKHVTIANKMESSGLPGRIHITDSTEACVSELFEVEPSEAGQNVAFLKQHNIRTYFVGNVKHTRSSGNGQPNDDITEENIHDEFTPTNSDADTTNDSLWTDSLHTVEHSDTSCMTLQFKTKELEHKYRRQNRTTLSIGPFSFAFLLFTSMSEDSPVTNTVIFCTALAVLLTHAVTLNKLVQKNGLSEVLKNMVLCLSGITLTVLHTTGFTDCHIFPAQVLNPTVSGTICQSSYHCMTRTILILIGLNEALTLSHVMKMTVLIGLISLHFTITLILRTPIAGISLLKISYHVTTTFMLELAGSLIGCMVIICYLERQRDILYRKLFCIREDLARQQQADEDIHNRNEALLYNIFVPQIAQEFLNNRRKEDELYSQAYDNVGVMFAACPHFEEFYTENSSFEDGLGSIRFLNEILSDYDQLLSEDRFKALCKIKTIGSTYMIASGLLPAENHEESRRRSLRWGHLNTLVNFAIQMKKTLTAINESSFNNFQLRIGINQGPVVAGVIGVKKPHYDIWGNTVNVASRMESTGAVGQIQVLPETMQILQRYGHTFTPRGVVYVKGKGELMTYYLTGNSLQQL